MHTTTQYIFIKEVFIDYCRQWRSIDNALIEKQKQMFSTNCDGLKSFQLFYY